MIAIAREAAERFEAQRLGVMERLARPGARTVDLQVQFEEGGSTDWSLVGAVARINELLGQALGELKDEGRSRRPSGTSGARADPTTVDLGPA